ncbi:hypothetical protein [Edaphosphingomonas haloaromaticamans]|uniref:hypothetical protein n=1 Tax=Edaphosphingomonas haloaromaticamans TaxID=653954 RepID=UPI0009FF63C7|nr:hypothetical protein [Sphingomonas haloaromaticamans]
MIVRSVALNAGLRNGAMVAMQSQVRAKIQVSAGRRLMAERTVLGRRQMLEEVFKGVGAMLNVVLETNAIRALLVEYRSGWPRFSVFSIPTRSMATRRNMRGIPTIDICRRSASCFLASRLIPTSGILALLLDFESCRAMKKLMAEQGLIPTNVGAQARRLDVCRGPTIEAMAPARM